MIRTGGAASALPGLCAGDISGKIGRRILSFDEKAFLAWAKLMAEGKARGRPQSALETIIAAIADANGCRVATANERDFDGLEFINPLRA